MVSSADPLSNLFLRIEQDGMPWVHARTLQVFALDRVRNVQLALGTGVLLKIGGVGFLLSAAHVLRHRAERTLLVFPAENNVGVIINSTDTRVSVDERFVDTAIARMSEECLASVERHRPFLGLDDLVLIDEPPNEGLYSVYGYPGELTETNILAGFVTSTAFCYTSPLLNGPLVSAVEGMNIALEFAAESVDSNGEDAEVPDPQGISGCGMWRMHVRGLSFDEWSVSSVRLVGIQHSVVRRKRRNEPVAFRGTRIHWVVAWIWQEFPDLRDVIDQYAPTLGSRLSGLPGT